MNKEVIKRLADLMRSRQEEDSKYVLMLGAGASLASGVPSTPRIMDAILDDHGKMYKEGTREVRFSKLWEESTDPERHGFLKKHLDKSPSPGYQRLAELIRDEYFDVVITFNFDTLLEKALGRVGFRDWKAVIRGETQDSAFAKLVRAPSPRVTILKPHGSLESVDTFKFSFSEMRDYPDEIGSLLEELTAKDSIVCGYAFGDLAVQKVFASRGGAIFCVNPEGVPPILQTFMDSRRSGDRVVQDDLGRFDDFFQALYDELTKTGPPGHVDEIKNPFKFLESHDEDDRDSFLGRTKERRKILGALEKKPKVIHVYGDAKVGKTSLIRAGVLPRLDRTRFLPEYCRCQRNLEEQFVLKGGKTDLPGVLEGFSAKAQAIDKHCVLILDQFEKVQERYKDRTEEFGDFLGQLLSKERENLTVMIVATPKDYAASILGSNLPGDLKEHAILVEPLSESRVKQILRRLSSWANVELEEDLVTGLLERYRKHKNDARDHFTMAHVQAVCHLVTLTRYGLKPRRAGLIAKLQAGIGSRALSRDVREALNLAINQYDLMSVLEDIRGREEKELIKDILKFASDSSREDIVAYVRGPFRELMRSSLSADPIQVE